MKLFTDSYSTTDGSFGCTDELGAGSNLLRAPHIFGRLVGQHDNENPLDLTCELVSHQQCYS